MRVKRGQTKKQKHKKVLKSAKGYRMSYSKLYRRAKEAVMHAGNYSFTHRKKRRGQFREEWIKIISAALTEHQISYSKFIHALKKNNIEIDRKNIAEMIMHKPEAFTELVKAVN